MTAETESELRTKLKETAAELEAVRIAYTDLRLKQIEADVADHEKRIRPLEDGQIKANTIYALFAGNGILAIISLFKIFVNP